MNRRTLTAVVTGLILFVIATVTGCLSDSESAPDPASLATPTVVFHPPVPAKTETKTEPELTEVQKNAVRTAKTYLSYTGFSRDGLIKQMTNFDRYPDKDATVAVDSLKLDFNAQAVRTATTYLDYTGFSRPGLIKQLVSFDHYTEAQANYAASKVGL